MSFDTPPTLMYAAERSSWIARNAGWRTYQRRRAALLRNCYDESRRRAVGTAANPHEQSVPEAFLLRTPASRAAWLETIVLGAAAVAFPVAWPAGRALYRHMARLVTPDPRSLHSVPITALAWIGAILMLGGLAVCDPAAAESFTEAVVVPWVVAQCAGTFMAAAVYGVLEGWLAVRGSTAWWPFPPPPLPKAPSLTKENQARGGLPGPEAPPVPPLRQPRGAEPKKPWEY